MNPDQDIARDLSAVVADLPAPIRQYIASGDARIAAEQLMRKYDLRLDQAGVFEREIVLLLIGLRAPDEFVQALKQEAALDDTVVSNIAQDVNTTIFMPLREKMREQEGGGAVPQGPKPAAPIPAPTNAINHAPLPIAAAQVPVASPRPVTPVAPLRPVPQGSFAVPITASAPVLPGSPVPAPMKPISPLAGALRSAGAMPALSDHEVAHIDLHKVPVGMPGAGTPLPTSMPRPVMPPAAAPSMQTRPPIPAPAAPPVTAPIAKYTVDPYREVPDESEK